MDPTATLSYSDFVQSLPTRKALVIGSGIDIDGRHMQSIIDDSDYYGCVVRVNKPYGDVVDVGTRCDVLVTRWAMWADPAFGFVNTRVLQEAEEVVILNQFVNYSIAERSLLLAESSCDNLSAGVQAVHWLLNRGCVHVDLIGFGFDGKEFAKEKRYCHNAINFEAGAVDNNPHYDFAKERQWLLRQPDVHFL